MTIGDYRSAAEEALAILADPALPNVDRAPFLQGYAVALIMDGDGTKLHIADNALREAESLVPGDTSLVLSRALLDLRRGFLAEAAAGARLVLERETSAEHPRARMVLLDTLLAQHVTDGRAAPELLTLLRRAGSDPELQQEVHHVCALAAYQSHAGDHAAAITVMRGAARWTKASDDGAAAITYHLAYVLARSSDAACLTEIDLLLSTLPPDYPSTPARAHTDALRNLVANDPEAALAAATGTLESGPLTPVQRAEVHLTKAMALAALGHHPEAARSRAEAAEHAPHHQLLGSGGDERVLHKDRTPVRSFLFPAAPTSATSNSQRQ